MGLEQYTAQELLAKLSGKAVSSKEIVRDLLLRMERVDPKVQAYVHVDAERALRDADRPAPQGRLAGVPVAVKDNICVEGELTRCASKILEGFRPPYNATVVERMKAEGAIPVGKTNMDEFAFGSSTESSSHQITRNPWDLDRVPGGSSGGSAAALAADEAILALGSDTGGSIRQPASLCGVVGMKPTYGRVSRYGLIAFASSLDQIGPLGRTVGDCALLLGVIAGHDPRDSTSADLPVPDYTKACRVDVKGMTLGVPKEYFIGGLDPDVDSAIQKALQVYRDLGAAVKEVSLPHTKYAIATYYIQAPSEASSNLARFDGVQYGWRSKEAGTLLEMYERSRDEGFGNEAKRRIILGTYALSSGYYEAYYLRAMKVRTLIKRDFDEAFTHCDALLTPTSPTPAFHIGEKMQDPLEMYLSDIFTISANLAGVPALSFPVGMSREGLPIGLQVLGRPFDEETLFRVAHSFEQTAGQPRPRVKL